MNYVIFDAIKPKHLKKSLNTQKNQSINYCDIVYWEVQYKHGTHVTQSESVHNGNLKERPGVLHKIFLILC
jgi:hypothetical protein